MFYKVKKYIKIVIVLLICVLMIGGCGQMEEKIPSTLNDIAHNVNKSLGYTVYIVENGEYVPYLVLTNNYNGNCLLLREHLLDEMRAYNYPDLHGSNFVASYYENSEMDKFLSGEFVETLSSVKDNIVDSEIVIADKDSIGSTGTKSKTIKRKVFLLSRSEITGKKINIAVTEGVGLKCFRLRSITFSDSARNANYEAIRLRIAKTASGEARLWWLRTADTWCYNIVYGVTADGGVSGTNVGGTEVAAFGYYYNGVRPAFCLPQDTAICEGDLDGEQVFVLGD